MNLTHKNYPVAENITIESLDDNHSLKKLYYLVGENKRVVDFGCATGYLAQLLKQRGCKVTGVEINPEAAKIAEQYCEQVIVADLDIVHLAEILPAQSFDVAIFGDVLEHLRDPWRVLQQTQHLLNSSGFVVASIPNIAHGSIRLALLQGKFEYTQLGILDNTHLRFFTKKTLEDLFENTGYFIEVLERTKLPIFADAPLIPHLNKADFSSELIQKLEQEEEAETLQFILRAYPGDHKSRYTQLSEQHSQLVVQLGLTQAQLQHIQLELAGSQSQLGQAQSEIEYFQEQLQQKQVQLETSQRQIEQLQAESLHLQSQLQQKQEVLDASHLQLEQTKTELEHSQTQLQQTQTELVRSHSQISAVESSKFWKLRNLWFGLKQLIRSEHIPTVQNTVLVPNNSTANDLLKVPPLKDIKFNAAPKSLNGCFDSIDGVNPTAIEVPNPTPLIARGWAILPNEEKPADYVIITHGKNRQLVAVAPVNSERPDVAQAFSIPAYQKSGWSVQLNLADFPPGKIHLNAWAYSSARNEATLLSFASANVKPLSLLSRLKHYYGVLRVKGTRYALSRAVKKIYYKLDIAPATTEVGTIAAPHQEQYARWLSKNFPRAADLKKMAETVEIFPYKPVISIVMPVFNPPEQFLKAAIASVLEQVYPYWELCIADDASTKPYVKSVLEEYANKDPRIKVVFRAENGHISRASNSALELATGEFVTLLDHDDCLTPDALYEVALLVNRHPEADMIYSDEDKIDQQNRLRDPFFKPEWCPDSFLSRMYTCHLGTYRRSLIEQIGGFRLGYEGSQDYDLVLRLTENTTNIFHIPKILYHWRIHPESTAAGVASVKSYAHVAGEKAIAEALARRNEPGRVTGIPEFPGNYSVRYEISDYKRVSIIIPTRNLGTVLNKCLESIFQKSTYPNYEVILIDNGSTEEKTLNIISQWLEQQPQFKCYPLDIPFNYSQLNNYAASKAEGDYLLFLNNDTEVVTPDWIEAMVEQAQRASIGAVGPLLLYPDNSIQHAGVVLGLGGVAAHSHRYFPATTPGYVCQVKTINNYSAITGACLMCRREVFAEIGGFDETLAVAYNDIDLCLKMSNLGYRNIYLPHVVLYHYESKSRGYENTPEKITRLHKEADYLLSKWQKIVENDPCYSPNLTRDREDYSINI
ncbi:glycosyltransferase [Gloeocapsopsis dulcis]|nr:glycosyltransferase [Gloeocapsopsis dulcis]WNN91270.1 glycosyltransferase [Gloeocapsopsis dulcis]